MLCTCQYNHMCVLEVVSLFLHFVDVTPSPGEETAMEFDGIPRERILAREYSQQTSGERFQWLCLSVPFPVSPNVVPPPPPPPPRP